MAAWDYTNDYSSVVNSLYTAGDATISVVSASGLPTSGLKFILKVDSEYLLCTSYSGTTLTVTGGQGGSTPANHLVSAPITACWIIPSVLNGIRSDQSQVGVFASLPTSGMKMGDRYQCTDSPYQIIYDGSGWRYCMPGNSIGEFFPPSLLGSWGWVNQGSSTITTAAGNYQLFTPGSASAAVVAYVRTVSIPYTAIVGFVPTISVGNGTNNEGAGIAIRDSVGGKIIQILYTNNQQIVVFQWNSATSFSSQTLSGVTYVPRGPFIWFKIVNNSTNRLFYISGDGVSWIQVLSQLTTAFVTENQAGLTTVVASGTSYPVYQNAFYWTD